MLSKTVVIRQPDFMPYLGFFHRLLKTDLFIILDNVQFSTGSWHNRDKIKTSHGEKWLSISIKKASRGTKINDILLSNEVEWRYNNLTLIRENYRKSPYFNEIFPHLEMLYGFECLKMFNFNLESIRMLMKLFGLNTAMNSASMLNARGRSNELLVDILQKVGATHYLSGVGARNYYDPLPFKAAGIRVIWQDFKHPVYPQLHGQFIPFLSSIDLMFNCGIKKSREILNNI